MVNIKIKDVIITPDDVILRDFTNNDTIVEQILYWLKWESKNNNSRQVGSCAAR